MDRVKAFILGLFAVIVFSQVGFWELFDIFIESINNSITGFQEMFPNQAELIPVIIFGIVMTFAIISFKYSD